MGDDQPDPRRCFHCDYPLKGLPDTHRCPECGLPYDPYTRHRGGAGRDYFWAFFMATAVAVVYIMIRHRDWDWRLILFALSMAVLAYVVRRWYGRRPAYFALRGEGLVLYDGSTKEQKTIPWSQMRDAHIESAFGSIYSVAIKDQAGKRLVELPHWFFKSRKQADSFVEAVRREIQAGSPPMATSAPSDAAGDREDASVTNGG